MFGFQNAHFDNVIWITFLNWSWYSAHFQGTDSFRSNHYTGARHNHPSRWTSALPGTLLLHHCDICIGDWFRQRVRTNCSAGDSTNLRTLLSAIFSPGHHLRRQSEWGAAKRKLTDNCTTVQYLSWGPVGASSRLYYRRPVAAAPFWPGWTGSCWWHGITGARGLPILSGRLIACVLWNGIITLFICTKEAASLL